MQGHSPFESIDVENGIVLFFRLQLELIFQVFIVEDKFQTEVQRREHYDHC